MQALVPVMLRLAATDIGLAVKRVRRNGMLTTVILLFALTAYFCAVAGGVIWAASYRGPVVAAFGFAAAFAVLALLVLAAMAIMNRRDRARVRKSNTSAALLATAALAAIPIVSRPKLLGALAIAAVGLLAVTRNSARKEEFDE